MTDSTTIEGAGNVTERGLRARSVMADLLSKAGFAAEIELTETDERIRLDVYPEEQGDAQLLIGRQGRTLAAWQLILNRIVNRYPEDRKPVSLDVSGFAEQRETRLRDMARRLAESARESGKELRLRGMNAGDRRIVHLTLADERGVKTRSEEEGIARRLVISGGR